MSARLIQVSAYQRRRPTRKSPLETQVHKQMRAEVIQMREARAIREMEVEIVRLVTYEIRRYLEAKRTGMA